MFMILIFNDCVFCFEVFKNVVMIDDIWWLDFCFFLGVDENIFFIKDDVLF